MGAMTDETLVLPRTPDEIAAFVDKMIQPWKRAKGRRGPHAPDEVADQAELTARREELREMMRMAGRAAGTGEAWRRDLREERSIEREAALETLAAEVRRRQTAEDLLDKRLSGDGAVALVMASLAVAAGIHPADFKMEHMEGQPVMTTFRLGAGLVALRGLEASCGSATSTTA